MAIRTRSLQNCWGRDQGNHKTVDGQGLHESQRQQPVGAAHQQHSANDTFLHDACNSMQRSGSKCVQPCLRPSVRTPRRSSATFGQFRAGIRTRDTVLQCSCSLTQPVWRGIPHYVASRGDSLKKPALNPGSRLQWPPADGKCRQCSGRWQCPETGVRRLRWNQPQPSNLHLETIWNGEI